MFFHSFPVVVLIPLALRCCAILPELAKSTVVVAAYVVATIIVYLLAIGIARVGFGLNSTEKYLFGMSASFSNSVVLGVPVVLAVFGEPGLVPLTIIILFNTVFLLGGTTILIEVDENRGGPASAAVFQSMKAVVANPVILAIFAGLLWGIGNLPTGGVLDKLLDILSGAVLPCGLVALGASMVNVQAATNASESTAITVLKIIVHPLAAWLLATFVFELESEFRALIVLVAALPVAGNVFLLAQKYDRYVERTASSFMLSTGISMLSLAMLIVLVGPH